jgi:hypothetical protein
LKFEQSYMIADGTDTSTRKNDVETTTNSALPDAQVTDATLNTTSPVAATDLQTDADVLPHKAQGGN